MAQITIDAAGRELAARVTRNESGEVMLVISAGEDGITINAGHTEDDACSIAAFGEAIASQALSLLNEWADQPDENDGWAILDQGWHAKLGGFEPAHQPQGGYPARQIAVYELAALMAEHGEFPPAWITGEHGPATAELDEEVRTFHDAGGDKLLPLPGVRFAPGTAVLDNTGAYWLVRRDYGDLGVMLYADGDESVTRYVAHPDLLTEIAEDSRS